MAKIEDLIQQIPDERLRKGIAAEVKALKKTKKFGLVFEEHLPETVRLPHLPVKPGELVAVKSESGKDGKPVCTDPDLQLDKDNGLFVGISNFILDHADKLLRPEDCDALLACQYVMHDSGGVNPAWVIGASLVQPARAGVLLHDALAHETRSYETAAGELAGALWRIRGPAELDFRSQKMRNYLA